jgi:enoyl-CoA hydratase/carnithine racemase
MPGVWRVERYGAVAVLVIDRPPLNVVTTDDAVELGERVLDLRSDPGVRVVVLTGEGPAFIGGLDVGDFAGKDPATARFVIQAGQRVLRDIEQLEKPVIAAVNGHAYGGGCEVALACDLRIASEKARFGQLEINYGFIPGWAATQRLSRIVGLGRAKEMILTGRVLQPLEALQMGLVSQVAPAEALMDEAIRLGGLLAEKPPLALALAKELVNASAECPTGTGSAFEAAACAIAMGTEDSREGVRAFLEGRKPDFKGL